MDWSNISKSVNPHASLENWAYCSNKSIGNGFLINENNIKTIKLKLARLVAWYCEDVIEL